MAESALKVIDAAGATTSIVGFALAGGSLVMQSIPSDTTGASIWSTPGAPNSNTMTVQGGTAGFPLPSNVNQVGGTAITLGQAVMATSFPVVLASNQSTLTTVVTNTLTAVVSGTVSVSGLVSTPSTLATGIVSTSSAPTAISVKATSGTLYGLNLFCVNTSYPVFLKIFNMTAAGVSSTVVPVITIGVPPGAPNNFPISSNGISLGGSGISYWVTKMALNNDTTAVGSYDLIGSLSYI